MRGNIEYKESKRNDFYLEIALVLIRHLAVLCCSKSVPELWAELVAL